MLLLKTLHICWNYIFVVCSDSMLVCEMLCGCHAFCNCVFKTSFALGKFKRPDIDTLSDKDLQVDIVKKILVKLLMQHFL